MASRGLLKTHFFSILRPVRGETLMFVCSYGCIVGPCSYACLGLSRICSYTGPLHIRENTQKSLSFKNPVASVSGNELFKYNLVYHAIIVTSVYGLLKKFW